jgi:hypothetical protein
MSTIKVNTITKRSGSTLTIGECGATVQLATGATQTGFGRTGTVDWCTTAKTSPFTAVSGKGYFVNTTSGAVTVTLPASPSAGDIVSISDYALTAQTNNITVGRNSSNIDGGAFDLILGTKGIATTLVYADATKGWKPVNSNEITNEQLFVTATGGTVTTSGDYKIHTFNSDSNFVVSCAGNAAGSNKVSYVVVAGGGGGGFDGGGGGGAGGYREGKCSSDPYTASPLATTGLPVSATTYPITIGGGGSGGPAGSTTSGSPTVFSTITSTGGGHGNSHPSQPEETGGSGGGGSRGRCGAAGNTPPVSPPQGNPGGDGVNPTNMAGGGGGATQAGGDGTPAGANDESQGGDGATSSINATPTARAGGGGGSVAPGYPATTGGGGAGGGGDGEGPPGQGGAGTANTGGGGGGGSAYTAPNQGGAGGSGVVIIRYKFQ